MKTTMEYLQILKEYKTLKAVQYGIVHIGIFGSVARGEHTADSDVDVYVDMTSPNLFNLVHIKDELQQLFGCPVDIVRLRQNMDSLLQHSIMEDGVYA